MPNDYHGNHGILHRNQLHTFCFLSSDFFFFIVIIVVSLFQVVLNNYIDKWLNSGDFQERKTAAVRGFEYVSMVT